MPAESGKGLFLGVGGTVYCQIFTSRTGLAGLTLVILVWYGKVLQSAIRGSLGLEQVEESGMLTLLTLLLLFLSLSPHFLSTGSSGFNFFCHLLHCFIYTLHCWCFVGGGSPYSIHRDRLVLLPQQHD